MKRKEANSRPSNPRSLTTSARRTTVYKRVARVWTNRENCNEERSKLSNSISNRSQGIVFHRRQLFSGGPFTRSKRTPVDVWSNHACQVALFFPGVRTASSGGYATLLSSPASGNAPLANQGTREPTGCVISKATKAGHPGGLAVTGLGKECTLTPSIRSESERELLDLHFHRRPIPEFQDTTGPETGKKQRQRQATNPEENRQRE